MFVTGSQSDVTKCISLICTHKSKEQISLIRFSIGVCHIFCLCFSIVNSVEEIIPCHLAVSLIDKFLPSHRCVISSFIFKSKLFHSITTNMVF